MIKQIERIRERKNEKENERETETRSGQFVNV